MLRITRYIKDTLEEKEIRSFDGVILIWNLTNTCNLSCAHCYASSCPMPQEELSLEKIKEVIPQLYQSGVKFAILSGGEPLVRKDIFEIAQAVKEGGIQPYLSTNGLLINKRNIDEIEEHFSHYVGISIDGRPEVHDKFRGKKGAFDRSLKSIRMLLERGIRVGIRFTITEDTVDSLPFIFDLAERENIPKVYLSHLVYAGRGGMLNALSPPQYREVMEDVLNRAFDYVEKGIDREIVTGNNEADAIFLYQEFKKRYPQLACQLYQRLKAWGGNQAGNRLVNITHKGWVKPDPFHKGAVGNIQHRRFEEIWNNSLLLAELRNREALFQGRCFDCPYLDICNGNSRARAMAMGDYWGSDPSCYAL